MENCKIQVQRGRNPSAQTRWSILNLTQPIWPLIITVGVICLGYSAIAATEAHPKSTSHFQKIEQPLPLKLAVTLGGFALIGAEVWWFLLSTRQAGGSRGDQSRINIPKT